jgi:Protein of unknown function (DUF2862)
LDTQPDKIASVFSIGFCTAMEIGQKVRVRRLRDKVSQTIVAKLGQTGVVRDFKMTDGSGVGVLVQFEDQFSTWFFEDEVEVGA